MRFIDFHRILYTALNIMRKVVNDSYVSKIIDSGQLFRPIKFKDLYSLKDD